MHVHRVKCKEYHYENLHMKCTKIFFLFQLQKRKTSSEKKNDIFLIFAQNIDCGYTLEPPLFYFFHMVNDLKPVRC